MKKKLLSFFAQASGAVLIGLILVLVAGANPLDAARYFFFGVFGNLNGFAEVMVRATPLIFIGLGISVAFETGFFNIGAEGQLYMGALVSTMIAVWLKDILPGAARVVMSVVAAFLVGGLWAFIPAFLKDRLRISETVNTIMFNYLAIMIVGIMIRGPLQDPAHFLPQSPRIEASAALPLLLPPTRLHLGFVLALLCSVVMWFLYRKTTLGFEMRICGLNNRAAFCAGMPVTRSLLLSAVISGGLAGLAGMSELLGVQRRLLEGLSSGNGYTAILIALLASNDPIRVVVVSLLFAALQVGANTMQRQTAIPSSIVVILTAFVVLIVLSKDFWGGLCRQTQKN